MLDERQRLKRRRFRIVNRLASPFLHKDEQSQAKTVKRINFAGRFAAFFGRPAVARRKRRCDSGYVAPNGTDWDDRAGWYADWHGHKNRTTSARPAGVLQLRTYLLRFFGTVG